MSMATATKEWLSPCEAAKLIGVKRDTILKHASLWGIRVRSLPRLTTYRYRLLNAEDVLRFQQALEAAEVAAIEETARTATR